jgi:hypothetical protein
MTKCASCDGTFWNIELLEPHGARFKYYAVQCSSWSVPIGVLDFDNIGAAIDELESKFDELSGSINAVMSGINQILYKLN